MKTAATPASTGRMHAILDSLIDERKRLQRGVPDVALLEANRLAIVYWQRELAQAAAAERADPEHGAQPSRGRRPAA
jgi:hypothetical protein